MFFFFFVTHYIFAKCLLNNERTGIFKIFEILDYIDRNIIKILIFILHGCGPIAFILNVYKMFIKC